MTSYDSFVIARSALGRRLRIARQLAGLAQPELARRVGVTHRTIQHYEAGTTVPDALRLARIAVVTGSRPEWLLEDALATQGGTS